MNLYKISQDSNNDWDTYDSAVVCAKTADEAQSMDPAGGTASSHKGHTTTGEWTSRIFVKVELIGKAIEGTKQGVIVASFNAG